ncbi:MAG: hypothetical protein GW822_15520 [Sphingomonadales bacterium]|nr:hypothetical protein [Sphingomonadales bacterium]PIW71171.1 MAG: hypothetical protein COW07_09590 [Hydrogenophilales bacterium CG12_big_fil_rev_8_21_14_0_65_61_21]
MGSMLKLFPSLVLAVLLGGAPFASARGLVDLFHSGTNVEQRCFVSSQAVHEQVVFDEIFSIVIHETPGRNFGSEQLFRPIRAIGEPLAQLGTNCLGGNKASCVHFANWVQKLADADALKFDRKKHKASPVSFVAGTLSGNLTLRPIAIYSSLLLENGLIAFQDKGAVFDWMLRRAQDYEHAPRIERSRLAQNLVLNSGATQLAVGIATSSMSMTERAVAIYRTYIDTMRPDGSFPEEVKRGQSALKYSNMAIAGLVLVAELGTTIELDLYSYRGPNGDIHRAISFLLDALDNEQLIKGYAEAGVSPTDPVQPDGSQARAFLRSQLGWVVPYASRFPKAESAVRIRGLMGHGEFRTPAYFDENVGGYAECIWGLMGDRNEPRTR